MTSKDYENSVFLVGDARDGGYILDFLSNVPMAKDITKRISDALSPAFEKAKDDGISRMEDLGTEIDIQKGKVLQNVITPRLFNKELLYPDPKVIRQYGDRSILKELDQILAIIRSEEFGENHFSLTLDTDTDNRKEYSFNRKRSNNFHSLITKKSIGNPLEYFGRLRALDSVTKIGKFINNDTGKTHNIRFKDDEDIFTVRKFLGDDGGFTFIGSPVIEYGSYDIHAGDIYFLFLRNE